MSRTTKEQQRCACGSTSRPRVAFTIAGASLRHNPRLKSQGITLYICPRCVENPRPATRDALVSAMVDSAGAICAAIDQDTPLEA